MFISGTYHLYCMRGDTSKVEDLSLETNDMKNIEITRTHYLFLSVNVCSKFDILLSSTHLFFTLHDDI